ncbi:MAG: YlmC/YmxH family sporulation protein [Endomicrobiales bacterium]
MLLKAKDLTGYTAVAVDGEAGKVRHFYFDDEFWTVRYLSVDVSSWIAGARVLITPVSVGGIDGAGKRIQVTLTREQIRNSPALAADEPISREYENRFFTYYSWPAYWGEMGRWGAGTHPSFLVSGRPAQDRGIPETVRRESELRDSRETGTFAVRAVDGEIGKVIDFILDDDTWAIRYIVVALARGAPAGSALLSPRWIERVSWEKRTIVAALPAEKIVNAPPYDPSAPPGRGYELRLLRYYGREEEIDPARAAEKTRE